MQRRVASRTYLQQPGAIRFIYLMSTRITLITRWAPGLFDRGDYHLRSRLSLLGGCTWYQPKSTDPGFTLLDLHNGLLPKALSENNCKSSSHRILLGASGCRDLKDTPQVETVWPADSDDEDEDHPLSTLLGWRGFKEAHSLKTHENNCLKV